MRQRGVSLRGGRAERARAALQIADYASVIEQAQGSCRKERAAALPARSARHRELPGAVAHRNLTRGDVIGRIESSVEAAAVALARSRAESDVAIRSTKAKMEYQLRKEERAKSLRRNDNIALSAADEAETAARVAETDHEDALINHKLAQLELARAVEVLKQRTIRSPVDGVVTTRVLGPGEYAFDQAHLVTVSQIDPLNVEVYVPLAQYGRINVGDVATVMPEAPVGGGYKARVSVVDQVFDAASGTIGIRLELPNPGNRLPAGLKCQVRFE